ncbi:MAG: hypothetical protein L0H53_10260 [Candidatus Nitrosocosmicus sp.]|nr:hypothetical protein [Candidatus Nitrosocosmicus sp.]MDN5867046.1 hypothetical protein [Candidatus Nitrosocosmicus sp.]
MNDKNEICYTYYDEYDHATTIRMDNPFNLSLEEAKKMVDSITKDSKKEVKKMSNEEESCICNCQTCKT